MFFFFLAYYCSMHFYFNQLEHTFLSAALTDAGTVIYLNFILRQFSALIGAKWRGIVRTQRADYVTICYEERPHQ